MSSTLIVTLTLAALLAARVLWVELAWRRERPKPIARVGFIPADGGPKGYVDFDPPLSPGRAIGQALAEFDRRRQATLKHSPPSL